MERHYTFAAAAACAMWLTIVHRPLEVADFVHTAFLTELADLGVQQKWVKSATKRFAGGNHISSFQQRLVRVAADAVANDVQNDRPTRSLGSVFE